VLITIELNRALNYLFVDISQRLQTTPDLSFVGPEEVRTFLDPPSSSQQTMLFFVDPQYETVRSSCKDREGGPLHVHVDDGFEAVTAARCDLDATTSTAFFDYALGEMRRGIELNKSQHSSSRKFCSAFDTIEVKLHHLLASQISSASPPSGSAWTDLCLLWALVDMTRIAFNHAQVLICH
jgi:hypothetical protein